MLDSALTKLGGRTDDKQALMKALRSTVLEDSPRGRVEFDKYGNVVGNIYILEVERRNGKLVNVPIKTYEHVSQFWKYDPEQFLAEPVYSRDYPPATHLEQ